MARNNNNKLKAFVRFDGNGRIIPSSLIVQAFKPKVGNWQEIDANECCNIIPSPPIPSITICNQVWSLRNLDVDTYANGDPIPEVTDGATWDSLTTGAWCWNLNDSANGLIYGKLYNWYAVNDPRGLAPQGWHVSTENDWLTLIDCLGAPTAGQQTKEAGNAHWSSPNTNTNSSGFTALPSGYRTSYNQGIDGFGGLSTYGWFWTSTPNGLTEAITFIMIYNSDAIIPSNPLLKRVGLAVRLVQD